MTSTFAEFVLGAFIPLAICTFFFVRPLQATLLVALGGEMFLPEGVIFRVPFTPPWDKHNLIYFCIWVGCLLRIPRKVTRLPKAKWFVVLSLAILVGGAMTGVTNPDAISLGYEGRIVIPGLTLKDGMYIGISLFVASCLPFYLGYTLFSGAKGLEKLVAGFGIAGLLYSLFALVEVRMSPQFHMWVYGYGVHSFGQTIRFGGYRPMVFLPHGLALAQFLMAATLALFVLAKTRRRLFGLPTSLLAWIQVVVLVVCKSTGAIILGAVGVLLIHFARPRLRLLLAGILSIATITYPLLRSMDMFPVTDLLKVAGAIDAQREESLGFRFVNEDILLDHARERLVFGWGGYARNRVFDSDGRDASVTDGYWIIIIGLSGLVGYICSFGILLWPVIGARRRLRKHGDHLDKELLSGLALIVALLTSDLIPNGLWCYYPFLLAGALTRRLGELESSTAPVQELAVGDQSTPINQ